MKHADFEIGTEFEVCTGQRWRCTDVGQRTILAIELMRDLDEAWLAGPPYVVQETVFDERDIDRAFRTREDAIRDALAEAESRMHPGYPLDVVETMMEARRSDESRRYPRPRLLHFDRVDGAGEILHPYAVEAADDGWHIAVYVPFTGTFQTLPELDFVRLRCVTQQDLAQRKQAAESDAQQ